MASNAPTTAPNSQGSLARKWSVGSDLNEVDLLPVEDRRRTEAMSGETHRRTASLTSLEDKDITHDKAEDDLPEGFREQAFDWATGHIHEWKDLRPDQVRVTIVRGGLTNLLFKISVVGADNVAIDPQQVLLRVYGTGTDVFFSRMMGEICFVLLSERRFGPRLYGVFKEGRLEEWFTARTLSPPDLNVPAISQNIALKTAYLHSLDMPFDKKPVLFFNIKRWLDAARPVIDYFTPGKGKAESDAGLAREFGKDEIGYLTELINYDLYGEAKWLEAEVLNGLTTPVGFCHNDLQAGNIMANIDDEVQLIDFEYANYNFVAYDIANHFCEWIFDYQSVADWPFYSLTPSLFPDIHRQAQFLSVYIRERRRLLNMSPQNDITSQRVQEYLIDINRLCLASHLLWTAWSIIQAECSTIDFPYLEYGLRRFQEYLRRKAALPALIEKIKATTFNI
eukprot:comp4910_c0_seq1/m.1010 comp4910_c0_seq1/g.1010  ORF comp4910_c0_seq1/g.1010 comp4910_c0_seq1/m.1010 type:complete len:451 (-) comp4910_c0_seq1:741-2093(-)